MGIITKGITCINSTGILGRVELKLASVGLLCAASILAATIAYPAEVKKPPAQTCEPKDDQVAVRSASGKCAVRGPGIYSNPSAIGLGNEPIDMIFVPSSVRAVVCGLDSFNDLKCEKPFTSSSWSGGKNFKKLSGARWTFLQVARWYQEKEFECRPQATEFTISAKLMGSSEGTGPCIRLGPGTYNTPKDIGLVFDIPFMAIDRDKLVDKARQEGRLLLKDKPLLVQIGSSVQMKMCRGDNFSGGCVDGQQNQRHESASIGFPGLLGSMRVWTCIPQDKQVVLFQ